MPIRKELSSFCLIVLLAAILRFTGICFDSLWLDESYQSLVGAYGQALPDFTQSQKYLFRFEKVSTPPVMLANFRKVDPLCPPLYALFLNRWIYLFGSSDFVLRSLSALISTISVAALMIFARVLVGPKIAIWAGLLNAVSPFDIQYAQEARMYSLVYLTSILSAGSLLLIVKSELKTKKEILLLPLYAISTWAMVNSHYTALFLAAAQGLCSAIYLVWRKNWRLLVLLVIAWVSTALLWIPWLGMFFQSASSRKESFYVSRAADFVWPLKALFLRIPINWLIFLSGQRVFAFAAPIYLSSAAMLSSAAYYATRRQSENRNWILALWIWLLLPALGLWLIDVLENHRVVEVARYVIYTAPAAYILAAFGLDKLMSLKKAFAYLAASHFTFAAINLVYLHQVPQREPWREMAAFVEKLVAVDDTLLVSQHYDVVCLDRYLSKARIQVGMSPAMGKTAVQQRLRGLKSFALLTAQDGESIKDLILPEFQISKEVGLSHGLHLRLYTKE
ncbi:MAG: glycosyltransferase family 39 protein [Candidatus Obscuribacterales bacterium]|nr:glycosyltransferase family 39 protein [Candidatus Obscuribacterales bacterium]